MITDNVHEEDGVSIRCPRCTDGGDLVPTVSYLKPGEYESVA